MKFKICGMRDFENIKTISVLKPDYMGFIFWEKSSRYIKKKTPNLPKEINKTGVFVDASINYIKKTIETNQILHGGDIIYVPYDLEVNRWTRFKDWMAVTGQVSAFIVLIQNIIGSIDWSEE